MAVLSRTLQRQALYAVYLLHFRNINLIYIAVYFRYIYIYIYIFPVYQELEMTYDFAAMYQNA